MEVISPAWRSDLALLSLSGSEITHRPNHVVVGTPGGPDSRSGNFLLLRRRPLRKEMDRILELFATELPGVQHRAFGVDDPEGTVDDLSVFVDAGFQVSSARVLTAREVHAPRRPSSGVELRMLDRPSDWAQRVSLDLAVNSDQYHPAFEALVRRRVEGEQQLADDGHGRFFGAFDAGRLVSALGIIRADDGLARFQEVQTHPEARRRGLASTLAYLAGQHALEELGASTLVMVADASYAASRVYRSIGLRESGTQLHAVREPA